MTRLVRNNPGIPLTYLKVSEGGFFLRPTLVQTVLGSCLGGAFHAGDVGAFFHAFLPVRAEWQEPGGNEPVFKFVDSAIDHVLGRFSRLGVSPRSITVSLLGGANGLRESNGGVGRKNVEAARAALVRHGLKPVLEDVGGEQGRRVVFLSSTGQLEVHKLKDLLDQTRHPNRVSPRDNVAWFMKP